MTRAESAEITRRWGRGLAAKELRRLDLTETKYLALVAEYEQHRIYLGWSQKRRMWCAWRSVSSGVDQCNILTHYAGSLEVFLPVEKMLAEFDKRQADHINS